MIRLVFSSIPFLCYFLPFFLIVYFAVPHRFKNAVLLLGSLVFYGWGEPKYVFLMIGAILAAWILGLLIERKRYSRPALILGAVLNLALLGYFKYADFFIGSFNKVTGLSLPLLKVALPIGISFYSFQILSYLIDVYRAHAPAQKNLLSLAAYAAMFPQLIAGPIVRYRDVADQLEKRTHSMEKAVSGIRRFVLGLAKKILLANVLGELCTVFKESRDLSVLFVWIYAAAFMLQIYFDFSGYSDMAIGLGRLLGFEFMENFNYPYIAGSITDFWRRWHISLGSWFRDYVYIPLGGNRVSRLKWFRNLLIVWLLTGLWHGAAWNFVIWGLYFAVLLAIEKLWNGRHADAGRSSLFGSAVRHLSVLLAVLAGFVLFDAASLEEALLRISSLFGFGGLPLVSAEAVYYLQSYSTIFLLAFLGATPLPARWAERLRRNKAGTLLLSIVEPLLLSALVLLMTAYLVDGSFNPFLYFRF